jgi:hypothetical protein
MRPGLPPGLSQKIFMCQDSAKGSAMTEIINLNQKRKAKARTDKGKKAVENRRKFGQTKEEKQSEKQRKKCLEKHLEEHKRDKDEE